MVKYEKTPDPNTFKEIRTTESEIYLDSLQAQIDELNHLISTFPNKKVPPIGATLDVIEAIEFWNVMNIAEEKTDLIARRDEKQALKTFLESL